MSNQHKESEVKNSLKKITEYILGTMILACIVGMLGLYFSRMPSAEAKIESHEGRLNAIDSEHKMDKKLRCYMAKKVFKKDKEVVEACLGY